MQKLPVYLYANLFEVVLDLDNNKGIHQIMYQRPLQIQKGIKTPVQIQFKNSDQKLLNISSSTFIMQVTDPVDNRTLLSKPVEIIDDGSTFSLKGLASVTFTESETLELDVKSYKFSFLKLDTDGSYIPAYSDVYYGVSGTLEIKSDIYPASNASKEVTVFQRYFNTDPGKQYWEYYSGNIDADPELQTGPALHTVAVYMTNYKGSVYVEATMDNSPSTFADYTVVASGHYRTATTDVKYFNFNGIFSHVRVRHIPDKDPVTGQNDDPTVTGTVDKILYRS